MAFNRGLLSPLGFGRLDLKRTAISAETQTNWIPRVLGSMMIRPGLEYIGATLTNLPAVHVPFVFAANDTAVLEFTDEILRVRIDDVLLTRPSVSSAVTNGNFTTDITTGWTDSDEAGATSSYLAGGYLAMLGNSTSTVYCRQDQEVTVAAGDQGVEHALRITVTRGPVEIKVGSTQGTDSYFGYSLDQGIHSLSFTPTGNFWIRLQSRESYTTLISDINVEAAGVVELGTNRDDDALATLRYDQSGDIIFLAFEDYQQNKVERRSTRSWSFVHYHPINGPFLTQNLGTTTLLPSALNGDITLTASNPLFETGHVGALFRVTSTVQQVEALDVEAENTFTDPIKVIAVGNSRIFTVTVANRADSTITLQMSILEPGAWVDVDTYVADTVEVYDDGLDNQTVYYRLGIKTGDYGTDTVDMTLTIESGSITGICKVTGFISTTVVSAVVLQNFGTYSIASSDWSEGVWSTKRGYPSAVAFHEGRLFWAGKDKVWGSVSDSFYNFDPDYEGDAGPINRSIGQGPIDVINWLMSGKTLLMGGDTSIKSVRSSNLDEPITVTNLSIKDVVTQGTAKVPAVKIDKQAIFVQASGIRVYELSYDALSYEYNSIDLTSIVPEVGEPSVVKIVVQRQPDTRVHCVRSDGTVALLVYDQIEEVKCWVLVETDGLIEDALVLPGTGEDNVYYLVNRTLGRYWEKWSLESENKGGAINKLADSHVVYSGVATTTIDGLDHLEGETVVAWGNTKDLGTYTVSGGEIELSESVTWACVGLAYDADFKSAKPALATAYGNSLLQKKIIHQIGVLMANTHAQGLTYGPDFDHLDNLPVMESGVAIDGDDVWTAYDKEPFTFSGTWDTDSRVCLRASAPRPCTLLAIVIGWNVHEKS